MSLLQKAWSALMPGGRPKSGGVTELVQNAIANGQAVAVVCLSRLPLCPPPRIHRLRQPGSGGPAKAFGATWFSSCSMQAPQRSACRTN